MKKVAETSDNWIRGAKEDEPTFFMSAEELQLFLLLSPQRVDDGDGQPERFLWVTV